MSSSSTCVDTSGDDPGTHTPSWVSGNDRQKSTGGLEFRAPWFVFSAVLRVLVVGLPFLVFPLDLQSVWTSFDTEVINLPFALHCRLVT